MSRTQLLKKNRPFFCECLFTLQRLVELCCWLNLLWSISVSSLVRYNSFLSTAFQCASLPRTYPRANQVKQRTFRRGRNSSTSNRCCFIPPPFMCLVLFSRFWLFPSFPLCDFIIPFPFQICYAEFCLVFLLCFCASLCICNVVVLPVTL